MIRAKDIALVATPASLVTRFTDLGQAPTSAPVVAPTYPQEVQAAAWSAAMLITAGLLVVGGMYYFKTAPKEKGFWKGWGYVNGSFSYVGAVGYGLVGLGLGGVAISKFVK